jgi:exodeoxyribonuclease VII small subunit
MEKLTIEQALERLNEITEELESNDRELMDIIKLYEEGTVLISKSRDILEKAELKVNQLSNNKKTEFLDKENELH